MGTQVIGVVATIAYSGIATFIILKVLDLIPGLGLREKENAEDEGLDLASMVSGHMSRTALIRRTR